MNRAHEVENVSVEGTTLHMQVDGHTYSIDLAGQTNRLRQADAIALKNVEVSPSGYGLHWPDIDEDLSIDCLIGVRHEAPLAVAEAMDEDGWGRAEGREKG